MEQAFALPTILLYSKTENMINSKSGAVIFSFLIAGAVLWPVKENFRKKPADNFPLSYYPMFSFKRGADYTLNYIVGYDGFNKRYYIPYRYYGSGGLNQARRQLNKKVKKNDTGEILKKAVTRIKRKDEPLYTLLKRLELARGTFDFDAYFIGGNKLPKHEQILDVKFIEKP